MVYNKILRSFTTIFTLNFYVVVDAVGIDGTGGDRRGVGAGVEAEGVWNSLASLVLNAAVASLKSNARGIAGT